MVSQAVRVLVVEDNDQLNDVLLWYLLDADCEVATALNGQEALRCLKDGDFDVVLTDLVMPGMSGVALLREIRESGSDLPVVFLSAYAQQLDREELRQLGVTRVFAKPVDLEKVVGAIKDEAQQRAAPSCGG